MTTRYFNTVLQAVLLLISIRLAARDVAIVRNFASAEIDSLQFYLNEMSLKSDIFDQGNFTADTLADYNVIVWDDLSYASGGITDNDVAIFHELRQLGKNFYFIGDDLPYAVVTNLSSETDSIWIDFLHLTTENNFSNATSIIVSDSLHPVINGLYGKVKSFSAYIDPDAASATNTGEQVVMKTNNGYDVVVVYEDSLTGYRIVTQNALAYQPGDPGQINRKTLFKNAVQWLILGGSSMNHIAGYVNSVPQKITLDQNYPNPFNPSTNITFRLPNAGYTTLNIFNIHGEKVETIVSQYLPSGNYTYQFNSKNLASGIYCYRLQAGDFRETKRMILLK